MTLVWLSVTLAFKIMYEEKKTAHFFLDVTYFFLVIDSLALPVTVYGVLDGVDEIALLLRLEPPQQGPLLFRALFVVHMEDRLHHVTEKEITVALRKIEEGHLLLISKGARRLWNKEKTDATGQVFFGCIAIGARVHVRKIGDRPFGYRGAMRHRHQVPDEI